MVSSSQHQEPKDKGKSAGGGWEGEKWRKGKTDTTRPPIISLSKKFFSHFAEEAAYVSQE